MDRAALADRDREVDRIIQAGREQRDIDRQTDRYYILYSYQQLADTPKYVYLGIYKEIHVITQTGRDIL